jgi:pyruvate kinase
MPRARPRKQDVRQRNGEASAAGGPAPFLLGRRTKIIATLGPASESASVLRKMIAAGMDVARLNFSHGTHAEHGRTIAILRALAREAGVPLAILQDLQGPKIRVGALAGPMRLQEDAVVTLTAGRTADAPGRIPIPFPGLTRRVRPGARIMLKDGNIELAVVEVRGGEILCRVVRGGMLRARQGVNLPGVRLRTPSLTRKDVVDLRFGLSRGVDYVALSFVRSADDLRRARRALRRLGRAVPIVAKLEKAEAIANLASIIAEADAVMVARGDLGVELPPEQVPLIQKRIIRAANGRGIPVITATQMLESMVRQERPTRAETSDVANAILDGTDAVMLSEETAAGRFPVETVRMMDRIARAVEEGAAFTREPRGQERTDFAHAIAAAARTLAGDLRVTMIVALTATGRTARLLSQLRPQPPVLACTEDERVARLLCLNWGVRPLVISLRDDRETTIRVLDRELVRRGLAKSGDAITIISSAPEVARGRPTFIRLHRVGRSA